MIISEKKTKAMIFNYTNNHQFTTRLELKGKNVEIVEQMKILGTVINSDLSWNDNCYSVIKKLNSRMSLHGSHVGCILYLDYENALTILNLDSLKSRRQLLCEKFAKSGIKHNKLTDLLQENEKKS